MRRLKPWRLNKTNRAVCRTPPRIQQAIESTTTMSLSRITTRLTLHCQRALFGGRNRNFQFPKFSSSKSEIELLFVIVIHYPKLVLGLTFKEIKDFHAAFQRYDADNDGALSFDEFYVSDC